MNKSEFISLIEHPETLGKPHIAALKHIAADFPYFQSAHTLLAKALYNEHHYEFEKHLKHTSLMVPDRAVLFRYIHNLKEIAETYARHPVEHYAKPTAIQEPVIELLEEKVVVVNEPEILQPAEPEPITQPVEEPVAEAITEEIPAETPQAEIIPEAEPLIEISEINTIDLQPVVEEVEVVVMMPEIIEEEQPEPVTQEPEADMTIRPGESHSFTEWLQLQQGKKIIVAAEPDPVAEPVTEAVAGKTDVPLITAEPEPAQKVEQEQPQTVKAPEEKSNISEFESILDKFIRENPRISRPKAEFYNPVNMAKQSIETDDEMVTETLANVYYKQGHYKKAIRAYEKLCLIYPHKMTYFASLIHKIKTENKD